MGYECYRLPILAVTVTKVW